ncbi:MAG: hypothetical protein ACOX9R_08860 [Armatimonadota bacterium]|jgi:ABC-type dipeptide/oligopeptide/nickel transport system permease subunit
MGEVTKLITGLVGVLVGLAAGFGILTLILHRVGGALFNTPALAVLVVAVVVGGSAFLVGYLALWLTGEVYHRRKKAKRESKKNRRFKK